MADLARTVLQLFSEHLSLDQRQGAEKVIAAVSVAA
jgi:hypothetical protein